MSVWTLGINHTTAPLDLRGRFAFAIDQIEPTLRGLRESLARQPEATLLSTCNRTEIYCAGDKSDMNPHRDPLAASAKRLLDQSVRDLDPQTTLLVQRARLNVLDHGSPSPRRPWLRWAGGMALASVVALSLTLWIWPSTGGNHSHLPLLEDLELMQSSENIELSEDLEFYDWLADGPATTG